MKIFPTLYQKTATGSIQEWTISVRPISDGAEEWGEIVTQFGQVGGKLQRTSDQVTEGKNPGKKNATTALEQAIKEAQAKWTKSLKKGYVESIEAAQADQVDALVEGGIEPMLAPNKSYPKDGNLVKALVFPAFFQPKLDGIRCIAIIENGHATLWSRTRKRIKSVPHIIEALERAFPFSGKFILDGELYTHDLRDEYEVLISIVRQDQPDTEKRHEAMEYHIYDMVEAPATSVSDPVTPETPFFRRNSAVEALVADCARPICRVPTTWVTCMAELLNCYEVALGDGYEGGMARNADAPYESGKRSKHLQKMKEFEDHEFRIMGVNEGRGKDAGTASTFDILLPCLCCTPAKGAPGAIAKAGINKPYAYKKEVFNTPSMWQGKKLTVTLKRWTDANLPYLPRAKAIRDYE
jgi:DNA ligase-1